ncbi:tonB-dependent siderophore receptor family protein [Collimonas fungivorans]|uniref:TonB-dependent siderophore receptor family protein n=1 Tax=Collimonas fungivorans TaxID=158899 RepID=A0A127PAG6_9BURK|nr:TonB-dependent siderophore receptor [Collimonas fungivorans]AMO94747.1 tonB-dependent siderophore receptor family protein [Collimonas fungivorans]
MNRLNPIAAALVAVFAAPLSSHAQQTPSPKTEASPAVLQEVVVEGSRGDFNANATSLSKLPADLHDVPQSVVVVNKALMQSQGANSLADALRNVAGITLGGAEGGQIGNNINLNGFSARTDIYLDGFRDRGQYYRDTFAIDEVEVLMGPSSMLFGRGSTGGVINQVTKKANLHASTEVSASATTNGLVRTTADYNRPLSDTSALRLSAMAQSGKATTRDQTDVQDFGLAGSYVFGIGTPTEITLSALIQHNHDMPDYGLPPLNGHPAPVGRDTAYGLNSDHTNQDVAALNATIKHKITPDVVLRNQTQFNYVRTSAVETAPQGIGTVANGVFTPLTNASSNLPLSSLFVRGQSHDRDIRDYSIFNQTELSAKLATGSIKHELLLGLELGHDGYDNQGYYRNGRCNGVALNPTSTVAGYADCVPLVNPSYSAAGSNVASQAGNRAGGSANTIATYVNDTMTLTPEFKLVGGLRFDRYIASITNSLNSTNAPAAAKNTALPSAQQTINFTSVRLGSIWQPSAAQSYYLSYGTSFNPSLEQLTGTTGQQNLDPEKNRSYELGGKWDLLNDKLSLNAAIFQIKKENARSQITTGVYVLDGTVRVNGARAGAVGHITKDWQVALGYTYLDAKVIQSSGLDGTLGKIPVNTPKNTLTSWSTYKVAPHWEVGGGASYMSARYANPTNTVQAGGYTRWDATVAYTQPKYDIRLNLFNLANKMYYDALIQSDGGRSVPGNGRTAMLSVNYRM